MLITYYDLKRNETQTSNKHLIIAKQLPDRIEKRSLIFEREQRLQKDLSIIERHWVVMLDHHEAFQLELHLRHDLVERGESLW